MDVVARRVREIGLGPFLLDLHDRDSRPTRVRQQITQALDIGLESDAEGLHATTENARAAASALTRYARRLHEVNAAGLSLYSSVTNREAVGDGLTLRLPPHIVAPGNDAAIDNLRRLVTGLPYVADAAHPSSTGPWSFTQVDDLSSQDITGIAQASREVDELIKHLDGVKDLSDVVQAATTPAHFRVLAELLAYGPTPLDIIDKARTSHWQQEARSIQEKINAFVASAEPLLGPAISAALGLPLAETHQRAKAAAHSSWFGRRKRLLVVMEELRPGLERDSFVSHKQMVHFVESLLHLQLTHNQLIERIRMVPGLWLPVDWNALEEKSRTILNHRIQWLTWATYQTSPSSDGKRFVQALRDYLKVPHSPSSSLGPVRRLATLLNHIQRVLGAKDEEFSAWVGEIGLVGRWKETRDIRDLQDPALGSLTRWLKLRRHLKPLRVLGLDEVHAQLLTGEIPADEAALALERGLSQASLDERRRTQGLRFFDEDAHNHAIQRYCESSERVRETLRHSLGSEVVGRRTFSSQVTSGQIGALKRELSRQRGGLSVRALMARYGYLITEIMPCVLVSPDSLARFFPVGAVDFDTVIFDEASQIRVADAIGAIGRARSTVVVGDSKQMPPTSVAQIALPIEEDEDDYDIGTIDDEESILSECVQARVKRRWLSWHYRSQDESLIAFSNARYYEGRLSSFPAPTRGPADPSLNGFGINRVEVEGSFLRKGRGKALRTNPEEAAAILDEVRRRFDASPDGVVPSIGIVTFNLQQRALIESLIRDSGDDRLVVALEETSGEGLFVKNLENVQGDERDVILFSTAFSVNERGILPLNFGPLNLSGGERRLNVAITRARRQIIIYSSFKPEQLRAEDTSSVGIKHLREYLDIAAGEESDLETTVGRVVIRDRHRDNIAERLRERGFSVWTDIGLSDFRVDLQIARADTPDQPLVAVLLDGPNWAQRATVNDRDGLPRQILGGMLKWPAVERIWLPTWLDNPESVLNRIARAVETVENSPPAQSTIRSKNGGVQSEQESLGQTDPPGRRYLSAEKGTPMLDTSIRRMPQRLAPSHATPDRPKGPRFRPWNPSIVGDVSYLDSLGSSAVARAVVKAVFDQGIAAEGPIHRDRLAKKVANSFGLERVAQTRIDDILNVGGQRPDKHGFYWPEGLSQREWREFRRDSTQGRLPEHISPLEIANAMREIALLSGGITSEDLKREASGLFGFKRLAAGLNSVMENAISVGLAEGRLHREGELFRHS